MNWQVLGSRVVFDASLMDAAAHQVGLKLNLQMVTAADLIISFKSKNSVASTFIARVRNNGGRCVDIVVTDSAYHGVRLVYDIKATLATFRQLLTSARYAQRYREIRESE